MLPLSCLRYSTSTSKSSRWFPLTIATRVSSGCDASISILFVVIYVKTPEHSLARYRPRRAIELEQRGAGSLEAGGACEPSRRYHGRGECKGGSRCSIRHGKKDHIVRG